MNRRQFLHAGALGAAALLAGCGSGGDGGDGDTAPRPPEDQNTADGGDGSDGDGGDGSVDIDMGTLGPAGTDLEVTSFDYGPGDDGNLTVTVGAKNTDDDPVTVVLVQTVSVEGETLEETRTLSFDANGEQTVTVTYDVAMSEFENASSTAINGPEWEWPEDGS